MSLIIGDDKIKSIYVGDRKIKRAYFGDELVYTGKKKAPQLGEWKIAEIPNYGGGSAITYSNGLFVIVSKDSNMSYYSTNLTDWKTGNLPQSLSWSSVSFGNNLFVASASDSKISAYSEDGKAWHEIQTPCQGGYVTYGDGEFVLVNFYGNESSYSKDGKNFFLSNNLPFSASFIGVTYGGGKFVAIRRRDYRGAYSLNGINWERFQLNGQSNSIAFGNDLFVIGGNGEMHISKDLESWETVDLEFDRNEPNAVSGIAFGDGLFVACVTNGGSFLCSANGEMWNKYKTPDHNSTLNLDYWTGIAYGNNRFVVISSGNNLIAYADVI